jgi:hypothetical protein
MKHLLRFLSIFLVAFPVFAGLPPAPVNGQSVIDSDLLRYLQSPYFTTTLSTTLIALDNSPGIVHDGITNDTAAIQAALSNAANSGGGNVIVGPEQYAVNGVTNASLIPTLAQYNSSGFTLTVVNGNADYTVGYSYTLSGFTSPLTQLNGTFIASSVGNNYVVFLTPLSGSQTATASGIGNVTQNLTIPENISLMCPFKMSGSIPSGVAVNKLPYSFIVGSSSLIAVTQNSSILGCNIISSSATITPSSASLRQNLTQQSAFIGTGLYVSGSDTLLRYLFIAGFQTGIIAEYAARARFEDLNIDANECIDTDNSHDISHYISIHCYPFLAGTNQTSNYEISNVANNGSGLWRVSATTPAIVGDTVYVSGVSGAGSVNNAWVVNAIGSGYLDLANSSATGASFTGQTVSQSYCIKNVSSVSGVGIGDSISGTNIPSNTTVTDVLISPSVICMNNQASASGTGISLSTSPQSYSSGGNVYLDSTQRSAVGLLWTNGETNSCVDCYVYGHTIGIQAGNGANWTSLSDTKVDQNINLQNPNSVCYQFDGTSTGTFIFGGSTQSCATAILVNSSGNQAVIASSMTLNTTNHVLELEQGRVNMVGNANSGNRNVYVGDSVGALSWVANDLQNNWEFTSIAGFAAVNILGNTVENAGTFNGYLNVQGTVNLGGGTNCTQFVNCGVNLIGPQATPDISAGAYAAYIIPANRSSWFFNCTSTCGTPLSTFTITLPAPSNGLEITFMGNQSVTTLTMASNGGTAPTLPTSLVSGKLYLCKSYSTTWYCTA